MISPHRFAELEGVIGAAVAQGARVLAGGKRLAHPVWTGGAYFEPTLVCDVTPEMDIARQERGSWLGGVAKRYARLTT